MILRIRKYLITWLLCCNTVFTDFWGNTVPLSGCHDLCQNLTQWGDVITIMSRVGGINAPQPGGHGVMQRKHWKEVTFQLLHWTVKNFIRAEENMKVLIRFFYSQSCSFLVLSETGAFCNFVPESLESKLLSLDTNLITSSVSGIRWKGEWQAVVSSGESSI